jgi:hypothetical protein
MSRLASPFHSPAVADLVLVRPMATQRVKYLLLILLLLTSLATDCAAAAPDYSKLIVGTWDGHRRIRVFHADGTWGVRKWDDRPEDVRGRRCTLKATSLR